ncbi:helix-turn-helix transcriptional regulator [Archangium minus]|uniref:Helix-turn-helix transcriptional regulator n=2 Tax=Archangium minus TaxID=83450 RepID=A0ABY9WW10_9BACT|nr:helix-turn-helix transcriptional regulator [Archangium minus]
MASRGALGSTPRPTGSERGPGSRGGPHTRPRAGVLCTGSEVLRMSTPPLHTRRERLRDPGGRGPRAPLEEDERSSLISTPPPGLSSQIDLCWATPGRAGVGTSLHELFPDAGAHLIFRHSEHGCRAVMLGPATERAAVEREVGSEYLVIRFRPGQAPRLADIRASELTNGFVELTHLGGLPIQAVAERLRLLPDLASRQHALAELMRDVAPPLVGDVRCRRATQLLEAHGGQLRVEALAEELGLNVRGLERRFLEHFGMTPKRMSRLVRLRNVLGAIHLGAYTSLGELAQACGYSDQAHLIHDFKALTNRLPGDKGTFLNRRLSREETRVIHRYRR